MKSPGIKLKAAEEEASASVFELFATRTLM
jgi:hypothetical protein